MGNPFATSQEDPPVWAIVARDQHRINFRCAEPPAPNPDKYADELLDAYLSVEDADGLYAEYASRGVEFARALADTPWHSREIRREGLRWPPTRFWSESGIATSRRRNGKRRSVLRYCARLTDILELVETTVLLAVQARGAMTRGSV